jgi:hypothetical protein
VISDVVVVILALCAGGIALPAALVLIVWAQDDRVVRGAGGDLTESGPTDGVFTDGVFTGSALTGSVPVDSGAEDEDGPALSAADLREQADELAAHATAAAGRAERATAEVDTARAERDAAEAHRDTVEAEYDAARLAYAEALRAARAGQPEPPTPEQRERRHEVESAALAAYRRGKLSIEELRAVFARTGDRDPDREALAQEAERLAARESEVRRGYDIAVAAARVAGERLHVAEVAATACTQEAVDAAIEAQVAADEVDREAERR